MPNPSLVVSNPPHGEVDLDAAAKLLHLDAFATRLKSVFVAPEIMEVANAEQASAFAAALESAGFRVVVLPGAALADLPWPAPVTGLTLDVTALQVAIGQEGMQIPLDADVLGVYCRPPGAGLMRWTGDVDRAIASGHGPTIASAIQRRIILDLYFRDGGALRRATVLPDLLKLDADRLLKDLRGRLRGLLLDDRLAGIRPRAPFIMGTAHTDGPERRRYSFGTRQLYEALDSIAPELRAVPQCELGSRLAVALSPLGAPVGRG